MIRCAAAERTFVAVYQISWLLTLDSRGRAEINYFWGETYSVCMPHKAVEGGVGPHTTYCSFINEACVTQNGHGRETSQPLQVCSKLDQSDHFF